MSSTADAGYTAAYTTAASGGGGDDDDKTHFHWADYLVFGLSLAVSLGIGIFFSCRQKTTEEFHTGGRNISFFPVALSLLASTLNAVFVIGVPAEIYYYGSVYALVVVAWTAVAVIVSLVFIPSFHGMNITSAYEYFERRYHSKVLRMATSATFTLSILLFLSIVLYAPAFAFHQVAKFSLKIAIGACGIVCTLYTGLGGMKAVVWTDTVQVLIIFLGLGTLVVKGLVEHYSGDEPGIMDIIKESHRFDWDVITIDPRARHTVWTQAIGNIFIWTAVFGTNQMTIQRYISVKNVRQAQLTMLLTVVFGVLLMVLVVALGYVIYVHYRNCDPLLSGKITKGDQLVPYFLMEMLGDLHGLPGLFTAAVFAAALSSVSSALNSLSAVVLEDFVKPIHFSLKHTEMKPNTLVWVSKGLVFFFGAITIGLSFAAEFMGDQLIEVPTTVWGVTAAPLLGVFIMGLFIPCSTATGALVGLVSSLTLSFWMGIGGLYHGAKRSLLMPIGTCNMTLPNPPPTELPENEILQYIYDISYVWIALIGIVTCLIVGCLVSVIDTGLCGEVEPIDPSLMHPSVAKYVRRRQPLMSRPLDMKGKRSETGSDNLAYADNKL